MGQPQVVDNSMILQALAQDKWIILPLSMTFTNELPSPHSSMSLLLAFEAAARHESYTRAALELSLTQSAVSRQVQALEKQLGLTLFSFLHKRPNAMTSGQRNALANRRCSTSRATQLSGASGSATMAFPIE